jgi:hypothetical protein
VVLVNTGTPAAPESGAVRRYLRRFLSDRRIIEAPRWFWLPLLNGLILPLRAPRSAAKYRRVWLDEGGPLKVYTDRLVAVARELHAAVGAAHGSRVPYWAQPGGGLALAAAGVPHRAAAAVPADERHDHRRRYDQPPPRRQAASPAAPAERVPPRRRI